MFLNIRPEFLVQTSSSLMLVENDSNHIVTKMFLTYTIITEKSLIKQKKMVRCLVKRHKKAYLKLWLKIIVKYKIFLIFSLLSGIITFIPSIFLELLGIGACDFLIPPLCKNESCEEFSHNFWSVVKGKNRS